MQGLRQMSALDVPMYITETGIADAAGDRRPLWLETYVPEVERAVRDGLDVRGLMYWTLVDNFEASPPCSCGCPQSCSSHVLDARGQLRGAPPSAALAALSRARHMYWTLVDNFEARPSLQPWLSSVALVGLVLPCKGMGVTPPQLPTGRKLGLSASSSLLAHPWVLPAACLVTASGRVLKPLALLRSGRTALTSSLGSIVGTRAWAASGR